MILNKKKKTPQKAEQRQIILRLLGYLLKNKSSILVAIPLMLASNILALAAPALSGYAINAIVGKGDVDFRRVYIYTAGMIVCFLASSVLSFLLSVVMINMSRKVVYTMRREVFEHLVDLPVSFFDKNRTGDLISRLSYDIDTVNASLSNDLLQICTGAVTVIGSMVMMFCISPILILVFAVTVPALVFFALYRVKKVKPLFRARSEKLGMLNGYIEEIISGQKTIHAYGKESVMIGRFDRRNEDAVEAYYLADYHGSVVGPSVNFINNISLSLISMFGAILFLAQRITIADLSTFILYSRKFSGPINETANIISEIQSATSAARRIFLILDLPTEKQVSDRAFPPLLCQNGQIEFRNVCFGYSKDKRILTDISSYIPSGKKIAIVGPTGSGKTTFINLLMRFYDPDSGEILIDGQNTLHHSLADVRKCFSMVLQDTWLFGGTIRENLLYGNPDASEDDMMSAAKATHIHDYVMSLPDGYDTLIDENGNNISKGQKQLINIARAMLVAAPIIILDEATSNVDSLTEARISDAISTLTAGKTSIIIAHRLSTIQNADCIFVIKDGRIVESGSHAELTGKRDGFYARLYKSQFEKQLKSG